ncbi:MAG: 4Fe-4S dicluster domain-containing protein [Acidobacteriota bacterium]
MDQSTQPPQPAATGGAQAAPRPVPKKPRKSRPKALIDENGCTGCEACIVVCPVDCIAKVENPDLSGLNTICRVDWDRCTGCTICVRDCPWDTIEMVRPDDPGIQEKIQSYLVY